MSKWIFKLSIFLALLAVATGSVVAAPADYGDECTEVTKISVQSGDPIELEGSPYDTDYYALAWSDDGFTLSKDGVALNDELDDQTISFDAPVAPGQYKVTLSVAQLDPEGNPYTTSCVDDICVQIEVTAPDCFTTTPICEEDMSSTAPEYCYQGTDAAGNEYAWYVFTTDPGAAPVDLTGLTADFTTKCMVLPVIDVPDGDVYNSRWIYLVVTDVDGLETYCGPTEQVILEDPVAGITDVTP